MGSAWLSGAALSSPGGHCSTAIVTGLCIEFCPINPLTAVNFWGFGSGGRLAGCFTRARSTFQHCSRSGSSSQSVPHQHLRWPTRGVTFISKIQQLLYPHFWPSLYTVKHPLQKAQGRGICQALRSAPHSAEHLGCTHFGSCLNHVRRQRHTGGCGGAG